MQLIYRGITYNYDASEAKLTNDVVPVAAANTVQPTAQLRYRGVSYSVKFGDQPIRELLCTPIRNLLYRGAAYKLNTCVPT